MKKNSHDSVKSHALEHEKPLEHKKKVSRKTSSKNNSLLVVKEAVPVVSMNAPKTSKRILLHSDVSPDKAFILCDGRRINNVRELADILHLMNDDMFRYHVTDTKNDFANWINDVYLDHELAKKIRADKNRIDICVALYKELHDELKHNK